MMRHRIADWRDKDAVAIQADIIQGRCNPDHSPQDLAIWSWSGGHSPQVVDDRGLSTFLPECIIEAALDYFFRSDRLDPAGDIWEIYAKRRGNKKK